MTAPTSHPDRDMLLKRVTTVTEENFDELSLDIFRYQFICNPVYHQFVSLLGKDAHNVLKPADIPFLPISLFKTQDIRSNVWEPQVVFESSATTGQNRSRHVLRDIKFYLENCHRGFAHVLRRPVSDFIWLALLPSYTDRPGSSLITMVSDFINAGREGSGFVTSENALDLLTNADRGTHPVAFISVGFALLDLAESKKVSLKNTWIIETGGMKGRRYEPTRIELHGTISTAFGVGDVCSEYGMTELLSQAWSMSQGIFTPGPTLRIVIRDLADPLSIVGPDTRGAINCIDLANIDSCAFIATDDLGVSYHDGTFEVLGRFDASELRGCSLLADQM